MVAGPPGSMPYVKNNRIMLFLFSGYMDGMGLGLGVSRPSFLQPLHEKGIDIMSFQDSNKSWYHFGVEGMGNDAQEFALHLEGVAKKYDLVVTEGRSMGGYAALLFGNMIRADLCLAFSPQTFIDQKNRTIRRDRRHVEDKDRVCAETSHPELLDLKKYLENSHNAKTCNIIFFDDQLRMDRIHASRMSTVDSFHLFTTKGLHNPGKYLNQEGILDRLFEQILTLKDIPESIIALLKSEPLLSEYDDSKRREKRAFHA